MIVTPSSQLERVNQAPLKLFGNSINSKMRVLFAPPSEAELKKLFLSDPLLRRGAGFEDISVFYPGRRRGSGIFSTISGIARKVLPFLFNAAKPSVNEFGRSVLSDMVNNGLPLKESLKRNGIRALKTTGQRILSGTGRRRRRTRRRKTVKRLVRRSSVGGKKKRRKRKDTRVKSRSTYNKDVYDLL